MKERHRFHGDVKIDLEEAGYTVFLETDKELTYEMKTEQELLLVILGKSFIWNR